MNCAVKIPADGFAENGAILWNPAKVSYAVPVVLPSLPKYAACSREMVSKNGNLLLDFPPRLRVGAPKRRSGRWGRSWARALRPKRGRRRPRQKALTCLAGKHGRPVLAVVPRFVTRRRDKRRRKRRLPEPQDGPLATAAKPWPA